MKIPKVEAPLATFFLRIPLSIMFLQQGLSKYPVDSGMAEAYQLPYIVWWFVTWGEIGSAIGLLVGGIIGIVPWHRRLSNFWRSVAWNIGDIITRFSAITMTCVVTGVIWIMAGPNFSLWDIIWRDYLHVSLYVGALYFALRGNAKYGV